MVSLCAFHTLCELCKSYNKFHFVRFFLYISSLCEDNILKCFVTRWVVDIHMYTIISHYMLQNYVVTEVLRVYKIPEWKISNQKLD